MPKKACACPGCTQQRAHRWVFFFVRVIEQNIVEILVEIAAGKAPYLRSTVREEHFDIVLESCKIAKNWQGRTFRHENMATLKCVAGSG